MQRLLRTSHVVFVISVFITFCQTSQCFGEPARATTIYSLPFEGMDARGFSSYGGKFFVFSQASRTLYTGDLKSGLSAVEEMSGWHISDVVVHRQGAVYCSRNRTLRKVAGKVVEQIISDTSNLVSIASDGRFLYLLDASEQPSILAVSPETGRVAGRFAYDGIRPVDLAVGRDGIYVLDLGDRCVHLLDVKTKRTKLKIQVGPGIASGCGGIVWIGNELYVHEADFSRLRPLRWTVEGSKVTSWTMPLAMTLAVESENESSTDKTSANFIFSVPSSDGNQDVSSLQWTEQPDELAEDRFGQAVAKFHNIEIGPQSQHRIGYRMDVIAKAIQYDPPRLPLESLAQIPKEIQERYLAPDPLYGMDDPDMIAAAEKARFNLAGVPATDARTLIENIVHFQSLRLSYELDDTWESAAEVIRRGTGSCSEYSFVFSGLCRLNGIPTRLVGGIQFGDYMAKHESDGFHRWTEVYFPDLGWIPVDATKYDDASDNTRDGEFLFGTPGYLIKLSQGGIDDDVMGTAYYVHRHYRGGKRKRRTIAVLMPLEATQINTVSLNVKLPSNFRITR